MSVDISEITGITFPTGGDAITLLPTGFEKSPDSREYHSNTISFAKFARGQLDLRYLSEPETLLEQRSEDWFGPIMLLTDQLVRDHPLIISIICGVISNYLFALYKTKPKPEVRLTLICEKSSTSTYVQVNYKGDIEGLSALQEVVRKSIESGSA